MPILDIDLPEYNRAMSLKKITFTSRVPCKFGHVIRYVASGDCKACKNEKDRIRRIKEKKDMRVRNDKTLCKEERDLTNRFNKIMEILNK